MEQFTIGMPVRNRISVANDAIQLCLKNSPYEILIIDDVSDNPDASYINDSRVKIIYNKEKQNIVKTWNQILRESTTDNVIFACDKIRPKVSDFKIIEENISKGFGCVATCLLHFFGVNKWVFKKIGLFDEGFKDVDYEDVDFMNRLFMNDIALYFSKETGLYALSSGWNKNNSINKEYYNSKWVEDFGNNQLIQLKSDESYDGLFLNEIQERKFLSFSFSELKVDGLFNYYKNKKRVKRF